MRRFYAVYNSPFYRLSKPNCKRMAARKALLIPLIISRLVLAVIIDAETTLNFRGSGLLYIYCNKHGLMKQRI